MNFLSLFFFLVIFIHSFKQVHDEQTLPDTLLHGTQG